jgi:N-acetyl sugar amidotransferase
MFDEEGICNICRQHEAKQLKTDWEARKRELDDLIESVRGKHEYDCIIPFSGGKDSTFTARYLVKEYGVKALLVRFDHCFLRPKLMEYSTRTIRRLGVDLHSFTLKWDVVQKLMLQSFLEAGDFCWHCHTGVFAYPMWVAIKYDVPLLFWGEPSSEYTAYYGHDNPEEVDEERFNRATNLGITARDMLASLEGRVTERDLWPLAYPPLKELRRIGCRSVCLGSYIPWDTKRHFEILREELGWEGDEVEGVPPGYEYEKIECYMTGVRDYIKYIKRGYARPSHLGTLDIRNSRMTREEAMKMVADHEGYRPPSLDLFLSYVGLTEEEFLEVAMYNAVHPHRFDPSKIRPGSKTHDFDQWSREGAMPRDEALAMLERWRSRREGASEKRRPRTSS